ncbi:hypothetical protein NQ317_007156 [Molorchus minor]|uniref:Peptidase S1 domain-containing protein n=1 Tax=Molorchus minor TaxID=1323400 RepID=A0ABQ9J511_9CUCU|nr:hypothetical protein NQ317_007156 [Molorchus minor]
MESAPSVGNSNTPGARIVGGEDATSGQYPYVVSLTFCVGNSCQHACGGALISPSWIASAGLCITQMPSQGSYKAIAGITNLDDSNEERQERRISHAFLVPDFDGGAGPHDLAIFKTTTPFVYNSLIQAVRLVTAGSIYSGDAQLLGWGSTGGAVSPIMPNTLQTSTVPILTYDQCKNALDSLFNSHPLDESANTCTGPLTGAVSACTGDMGGPLVQNNILMGVVSWIITPCGTVGAPSIQTRVAYYRNWIVSMEKNNTALKLKIGAPNPDSRIVGGWDAQRGEFTSIVSLQYCILTICQHSCGGSIISPSWILTAAHCITEVPAIGSYSVLAGVLDLDDNIVERQLVRVSQYLVHADYAGGVGPHDIALFRLASPLIFNQYVQPVSIPLEGAEFSGQTELAGWGSTGGIILPQMPNRLQTVTIPIVPVQECDNALSSLLQSAHPLDLDANICTGPLTGGTSACSGDSGGPLYKDGQVVGIVSWGVTPCGTTGAPSVYVKTSHYINWIRQNVDEPLIY